MRKWLATVILLVAACLMNGRAEAQLRWTYPPQKSQIRVRLIAVALADPRSSFFESHEVFVAETEIGFDEWKLIKLIFTFLPYQPRLLEEGFDYSLIHEMEAWRNEECDETVAQLTLRTWPNIRHEPLKYARDVPRIDLDRRRIPLPCYVTSADDYGKATRVPVAPVSPPEEPALKERVGK